MSKRSPLFTEELSTWRLSKSSKIEQLKSLQDEIIVAIMNTRTSVENRTKKQHERDLQKAKAARYHDRIRRWQVTSLKKQIIKDTIRVRVAKHRNQVQIHQGYTAEQRRFEAETHKR